jgi:hypothetical protein
VKCLLVIQICALFVTVLCRCGNRLVLPDNCTNYVTFGKCFLELSGCSTAVLEENGNVSGKQYDLFVLHLEYTQLDLWLAC